MRHLAIKNICCRLCFCRGEKPYDCSLCSKSFCDPSARRRHVASHSGNKPFTCSLCSLSFTRLDNLKTHAKTHTKERAAPVEELRGLLQLQQYQLPSGSDQEIQLLVTADVGNIDFVPGPGQEISIIATEGEAAPRSRLALLAQPEGHVQNHQSVELLEGPVSQVLTLSKEAVEQLGGEQHRHPIRVSSQSSQPISISQTSEQISSRHIQGQTFQIQAGTVSYLYTTGLPQGGGV